MGQLLAFLDPMTAMRVFSYSSIVFGILLAALGVFLLMKAKRLT